MANSGVVEVTIVGNCTGRPEMRQTPNGKPVASFTVASTKRRWDRENNEFVDANTSFFRCSVWGDQAEHAVETFDKGDRVIVTGEIEQKRWVSKDGENRSTFEVNVSDCGLSIRHQALPADDREPVSSDVPF